MSELVLVTGPDGFVGRAVCARLLAHGHKVRAALWRPASLERGCEPIVIGDIAECRTWEQNLRGVDSVVHLAARVHVMNDDAPDPSAAFRRTNVEGTRRLAAQAADVGVRRFVFMSTIKVHGETSGETPFRFDSPVRPLDPYSRSKAEAEEVLFDLATRSSMEIMVVRPPLVYGPGVGANFLRLVTAVHRRVPLPLGAISNARSLLGLQNLAQFVVHCLEHSGTAEGAYLLSDGRDLSTPELVRHLARALGVRPLLLPVPVRFLKLGGKLIGRPQVVDRLCDSLSADIAPTRRALGWEPAMSVEDELTSLGAWFLNRGTGLPGDQRAGDS